LYVKKKSIIEYAVLSVVNYRANYNPSKQKSSLPDSLLVTLLTSFDDEGTYKIIDKLNVALR